MSDPYNACDCIKADGFLPCECGNYLLMQQLIGVLNAEADKLERIHGPHSAQVARMRRAANGDFSDYAPKAPSKVITLAERAKKKP